MGKLIKKSPVNQSDFQNSKRQFLKIVGSASLALGVAELARRLYLRDCARNEKGYKKWVEKIRREKELLQNPSKNSRLAISRKPVEEMQNKWIAERQRMPTAPLAKPENFLSQRTVNGTKYSVVGFNPNGVELVPLLPQDAFRT